MKSIKLYHFVCLLLYTTIFTTSCKKDWFDVKSDITLTVPATLQDFEYLLDDFIVMNQDAPGLAEVGSDGHLISEAQWSSFSYRGEEKNAYTWSNSLPYLNVTDWNLSYKRIFQCNLVLDGLNKIKPGMEQMRYNRIKGNALFHRAANYYGLAQIYAQPYNPSSANSDIGIPLKEGIDVTEPAKRTSVKQTYNQILLDLRSAASLLPNLPEVKTRGSKNGAFALLARTYLTIGDFVNAGVYADSALRINDNLIDFISISPTATNMGFLNIETIFFTQRVTSWVSTWRTGNYSVDPLLYSLYENNDLRKTRFFSLIGGNIIFKGNYNWNIAGFGGLAIDEQYLIRAECFARAGNFTAAMKDLNDLLITRWNPDATNPAKPYVNVTAADSEDALRKVLLERKKELLFRNLRWTDLRRLNLDPRFKETLTRTIAGKTYTLDPNSYKYTLPIPNDVMSLAPQMQQTPGWE